MSSNGARWHGLDGLRALAVIAVVAYHFTPDTVPGGFLGVDVFFVLSGYLITRLLVTEFVSTGRIDFRRFYLRRARRLFPALGALLVVALAAAAFWRDQLATVRQATLAAATYVSNWWQAFDHQSYFVSAGRPSMLQHLWSLAVEEQFYLLWPVVALLVLTRRGGSRTPVGSARRLAAAALVLALASTGLMVLVAVLTDVPYGADGSRLYYGTDTHSMGLLLGAAAGALAAARIRPNAGSRWTWATDLLAVSALAALAVLVLRTGEYDRWLYRGGFLAVAAVACVAIAAVVRPRSRVGRALEVRPLRWIGARSYAIYLWHYPVTVLTRPGTDVPLPSPLVQLIRVALTLALAEVSYRFLERPIRRYGFVSAWRHGLTRAKRTALGRAPVGSRLASVSLVAVVVLAGAVLIAAPQAPTTAAERSVGGLTGSRVVPLEPARAPSAAPSSRPVVRSGPASTPQPSNSPRPSSSPHPSAAPAATGPRPASAFGDSVMLGARQVLSSHFPGGTLDAVEGRQPGPILDDVQSLAQRHQLHRVVIIGVGDNGLINPDTLSATLSTLRGYTVIVINNRVGRAWEAPNNQLISQVTSHYPWVRLLDWYNRSANHPGWFYDDGIHLTPDGAVAYGAMLAQLAA